MTMSQRFLHLLTGVFVLFLDVAAHNPFPQPVKLLNITPGAVFVGLLVTTAAVVIEALYELAAPE